MNYLLHMFQVAIVVGGGNIFRGSSWAGSSGLDRSSADYIGYRFCNTYVSLHFPCSFSLYIFTLDAGQELEKRHQRIL